MDQVTAEKIVAEVIRILADKRKGQHITLEDAAAPAGLHRTTVSLWEKGERSPTILAAVQIAASLGFRLSEALAEAEGKFLTSDEAAEMSVSRTVSPDEFRNADSVAALTGLSPAMFAKAIERTYATFDIIDARLTEMGVLPLGKLVELANLSSMIGNVFGGALADVSDGKYTRNRPHTYPDLVSSDPTIRPHIEIKIALETNKPKGHLAKAGLYLTLRYVLTERTLVYNKEERGPVASIWEIRLGELEEGDFDLSNTAGDSGKTAVVKTESLKKMNLIYYRNSLLPYRRSKDLAKPYDYFN